ncbi:transglutaminase domain-containing protein [Alicyclobacillus fodiniaquatilis]|jgi:hypothetical protein|uniref:Transglutaminase domain-containing protein n=1 Tax=Alicyclobacillus fodiniaquatilis TaxID=1661150 RepID=A0ABW4JJW1_9BACL
MTYNWITILFAVIIIGSILFGAARRFGMESRLVVSQAISIATGIVAIWIGWLLSRHISSYVLHQNTTHLPHWLAQIFIAWQRSPRIGAWIAFLICYFVLSSVIHQLLAGILGQIPVLLPSVLGRSRVLGAVLGAAIGVVRAAIGGAIIFLVLQYFSIPVMAKQANQSWPYQLCSQQIYKPWLKPFVTRALPVFAEDAIQPISQNINLFAVPSGTANEERGVLLVPKQVAKLAQQITANAKTPKQKAYALYEWEIHHITYDWKKYDDYVYHHKWDQQSPLQTLETKKGVCADYALLYADMAHAVGLRVQIDEGIGGTATDYGSHAWNQVWLPNENQWITVDTTWGATQDEWFDVPAAQFNQTHSEQTAIVIDASQ